jgi:predicted metalloendopeptidase
MLVMDGVIHTIFGPSRMVSLCVLIYPNPRQPMISEIGTITFMADNNEKIMKSILEGPYDEKAAAALTAEQKTVDKANFKKLKDAYTSCINEDVIKASGVAPMQKLLEEFEKQFPVGGSKKADDKDELTNVLIWLAQRKFSDLLTVTMQV